MFESFAIYLESKGGLTGEELEYIESLVSLKRLQKNQYLLTEDEICKHVSFIVKGCMRLFHVGENGNEHNLRFAIEDFWISDYESFHAGRPSKNNIQAIEECDILMIEKKDFHVLLDSIPNFEKLIRILEAKNFEVNQKRILSHITESADEKYNGFIKQYPLIYNRVPLHMIASYLGVSRETLTRVRQQRKNN